VPVLAVKSAFEYETAEQLRRPTPDPDVGTPGLLQALELRRLADEYGSR